MYTLGLIIIDQGFFSSAIARIAFYFIQKLVKGGQPEVEMWDLEEGDCVSLVSVRHLKLLHCINPNLYLFDYGACLTVRWKLAVTNAVDALYVC